MNFQTEFAILSHRENFQKGVALFNSQHFFECHDVIEEIWLEQTGEDRTFFQGIIHVAVGFYHLGNKNFRGARSQLSKGIAKLRPYQPAYYDVELSEFLERVTQCRASVTEHEQGMIHPLFEFASIPKLEFVNQ